MQTPFWTIDYAYHPDFNENLHEQILTWADSRARKILDTPSGHPMWFVNVFVEQTTRIRNLEDLGFASQSNVGEDSWSKVQMLCSVQTPCNNYPLPKGFIIRPLAGENEVDTYVELHQAVFESRNMTTEWRARTLQCTDYMPDLDLVAVAPDGRLAAFCVCWLNRNLAESSGQIEPLGVQRRVSQYGVRARYTFRRIAAIATSWRESRLRRD